MAYTKEQRIINSLSNSTKGQRSSGKDALSTGEFIMPNNSGDHKRSIKRDVPIYDYDLVNKSYVDTQVSTKEDVLSFSSPLSRTADTISFLFNTNNTWTGTNTFSNTVTHSGAVNNNGEINGSLHSMHFSTDNINVTGIASPYLKFNTAQMSSTVGWVPERDGVIVGLTVNWTTVINAGSLLILGLSFTGGAGTINNTLSASAGQQEYSVHYDRASPGSRAFDAGDVIKFYLGVYATGAPIDIDFNDIIVHITYYYDD